MKILFTASQETCLNNIIEIQKTNLKENYNFLSTFISQHNLNDFSNYELSHLKDLHFDIKNLNLPIYLSKNTDRKLNFFKRYLIYFKNYNLIKYLVDTHDVFIFSPGGFFEHKIAYKAKKYGKKTVLIEGGIQSFDKLELHYLNVLGSRISKKLKNLFNLDIFKLLIINDAYQEVDFLVTTGSFSKTVWKEQGIPENKILDIGVPRYSNLSSPNKIKNQKNIVYATGSYIFHNDLKGEEEDLKNIKELYALIKEKRLENIFNIMVHPREMDNSEKLLYTSNMKINQISKDNELFSHSSLLLSRHSSLVYEHLASKSNAYFYKPNSSRESIPNVEFTIYDKQQLNSVLDLYIENKLIQNFNLVSDAISNSTNLSTKLILDKCL